MQQILMDIMFRLLSCREHHCVILSRWKCATNIRLLTSCCSFICLFLLARRCDSCFPDYFLLCCFNYFWFSKSANVV